MCLYSAIAKAIYRFKGKRAHKEKDLFQNVQDEIFEIFENV